MGQLSVRNHISERGNVWYWRARYWWMDTESGRAANIALCCLAALLAVVHLIAGALGAMSSPAQGEPQQAIYAWVVQIIIAIVMAIISYAMAPKPPDAQPMSGDMPTVDDGQAAVELHGDGWIKEEFIMAQQVVGKEPIKSKGKK